MTHEQETTEPDASRGGDRQPRLRLRLMKSLEDYVRWEKARRLSAMRCPEVTAELEVKPGPTEAVSPQGYRYASVSVRVGDGTRCFNSFP